MNHHSLFIHLNSLPSYTLDKYEIPCYALQVYVWEWMDSLGVSGDTLLRSWFIGLVSRDRANLTRSWIEGLGCVSWNTLQSTCGGYNFCRYYVEEMGALIIGAVVDHCEGYSCETKMLASAYEDHLRVTMICGTMLSMHTTYTLCRWVQS
jgi:hypothetical protein